MTAATPTFETANPEQAAAWNGQEGQAWTEHAARYERSSWRHQRLLLDRITVEPDTKVLDIGCGTGHVTCEVARLAVDGAVLGVDLSAPMLDLARQRSGTEGLTHLQFVQADAQVHPFGADTFDIAISMFGCMFFADPVAAFANIGGGLRTGATVAFLAWRPLAENAWLTEVRGALALGRDLPTPPADAPTPFALADPDRVRSIFTAAGYSAVDLEPVDEAVEFGTDADDAYSFMRTLGIVRGLTEGLDEDRRAEAHAALRQTIAAHETPDGVLFGTAAWLITARRP